MIDLTFPSPRGTAGSRKPTAGVAWACVFVWGCGSKEAAPAPTASSAPVPAASSAAPVAEKLSVPDTQYWDVTKFEPMKLSFRRPPTPALGAGEMISGAGAGRTGEQIWGMSTKTDTGVEIVLLELGPQANHDREKFLGELRAGASPGEIVFDEEDAVLKKARVLGTKSADRAVGLSETHADLRACKKLGDTSYCFDLKGTVDIALGRPGLPAKEAVKLIGLVRSLEKTGTAAPKP